MIHTDGRPTIAHYPARGGRMIETTKTGKTHLTWRAAQAWLAGYSDGLEGNPGAARASWAPDYAEDYDRGQAVGESRAELRAAA